MEVDVMLRAKSAPCAPAWTQAVSLRNAAPEVRHGFSGVLKNDPGVSFPQALRGDLRRLGVPAHVGVYTVMQIHSAEIVEAGTAPFVGFSAIADGVILPPGEDGIAAIQVADCVPILAVRPETGTCAALHAGWRGTAAGILPRVLERWHRDGSAGSVHIALGPSIRGCCYEVRGDCLNAFTPKDLAEAVEHRGGRSYLDLTRVLRNQARRFGLEDGQIEVLDACTCCAAKDGAAPFASFRREGQPGKPYPARNAAFIGRWGEQG